MGTLLIVQLNNSTPIIPKRERFAIPGIPGTVIR
jgi:hypothetical protein